MSVEQSTIKKVSKRRKHVRECRAHLFTASMVFWRSLFTGARYSFGAEMLLSRLFRSGARDESKI